MCRRLLKQQCIKLYIYRYCLFYLTGHLNVNVDTDNLPTDNNSEAYHQFSSTATVNTTSPTSGNILTPDSEKSISSTGHILSSIKSQTGL